jgi:hypothetical protein
VADGGWVSGHLFSHGDLDALLARAVRPLVAELARAGNAGGFFFLRHWDGGPHIRLRLLARTATDRPVLRRMVRERCGGYLREHPSPAAITQQQYGELASSLARQEGAASYLSRLQPDGSVRFIGYRREHARYGDLAAMRAIEEHFERASEIALSLVSLAAPEQRRTAAFCMVLLAWTGAEIPAGWSPPSDMTTQDYARQRDRLAALAAHCRALAAGPADTPGALPAWCRSLGVLRSHLNRLGPGHLAAPVPTVIDTCAHLMCNRLGLSLDEESRLRYLAGHTLADNRDWLMTASGA